MFTLFLLLASTIATTATAQCGGYDPFATTIIQNAQKCFNNPERLELKVQAYLKLFQQEVASNADCKYLHATYEGDNSLFSQEIKDLVDQLSSADDPIKFLQWLQKVPEQSYINVCNEIAKLQSCIIDGLLPIISKTIKMLRNDQCCNAFVDTVSIKEFSIEQRIEMIAKSVPNLFCLNRIADSVVTEELNCGYVIVQSMFPPVYDEIVSNLKALVQIPNDQACTAFNGNAFLDTNGNKNFLSLNLPLGSCSSAFDTIFSTLKAMVIGDGDSRLYDLATGTGLIPLNASKELENEIGPLANLFDDNSCTNVALGEGLGEVCLNLPTEFTRTCYPALTTKGVYGGPIPGLFDEQISGGENRNRVAENSENNATATLHIGLHHVLLMMIASLRWL
jgi:hypothetical protein